MTIFDRFHKLLGRAPSDKEMQAIIRTQQALELRDNDALWSLLMALQSHQTQFEAIPARIEAVAANVTQQVETAAKQQAAAAAQKAQVDMLKQVEASFVLVSKAVKIRANTTFLAVTIASAMLIMAASFLAGQSYGRGEVAQTQSEAAAWGNSAEGKAARYLNSSGWSFIQFAECTGPGLRPNGQICSTRSWNWTYRQ